MTVTALSPRARRDVSPALLAGEMVRLVSSFGHAYQHGGFTGPRCDQLDGIIEKALAERSDEALGLALRTLQDEDGLLFDTLLERVDLQATLRDTPERDAAGKVVRHSRGMLVAIPVHGGARAGRVLGAKTRERIVEALQSSRWLHPDSRLRLFPALWSGEWLGGLRFSQVADFTLAASEATPLPEGLAEPAASGTGAADEPTVFLVGLVSQPRLAPLPGHPWDRKEYCELAELHAWFAPTAQAIADALASERPSPGAPLFIGLPDRYFRALRAGFYDARASSLRHLVHEAARKSGLNLAALRAATAPYHRDDGRIAGFWVWLLSAGKKHRLCRWHCEVAPFESVADLDLDIEFMLDSIGVRRCTPPREMRDVFAPGTAMDILWHG